MLPVRVMHRRDVLTLTATTVVGLALSSARVFAQASNGKKVTDVLADYMSAAGARPLPPIVAENAKYHLLDTLASMISGSELLPGQSAQRYIRAHGGKGGATIAGTSLTAGPADAALANGIMAHADETDDSHNASRSHPGCAVVPAALAVGEELGIDGARFLRAVTLGYDIGPRVVMAMGGADWSYETSLATHSIAGTFGAAAAAGSAAGLSAQQMRWLLDYAGQQASGIAAWQRDTEHIEKSLVFAGMPARNGVSAALLIQLGGTGVDDIFSGADNFLLSFAPQADPARLIDKLGERYEVTRTNIKKWTVGSPIQAPLDALENLRKRHPFEPAGVQRVAVRLATSEAKTVNDREMPDISLQYMVAVMLLDKTASFAAAHDKPRMQDAAVQREKAKVQLIPDEELERLYPRRETLVEVTLTDGTKLTERVGAVRGTAENPMTREEVVAKCRDLTAPVLGSAGAGKLITRVLELEKSKDIRELRPLLQAG